MDEEHNLAGSLAAGRTIMANDRTLLAFLRTSLTFLVVGIGLIEYVDHPIIDTIGWILILLTGVFLTWGIRRYRCAKKILKQEAHSKWT